MSKGDTPIARPGLVNYIGAIALVGGKGGIIRLAFGVT
jgi:hypothetical protein